MNFDKLNKMIDYIEANLDEEIDDNKLSKITNTNIFILERIFMFLTNMNITEYIANFDWPKRYKKLWN